MTLYTKSINAWHAMGPCLVSTMEITNSLP